MWSLNIAHATGALALLLAATPLPAADASSIPASAPASAPPGAARPDPLDPRARVPSPRHRTVLSRPLPASAIAPAEPGDWRAANDEVHRIGGWRTYAREAAAAAPAASGGTR